LRRVPVLSTARPLVVECLVTNELLSSFDWKSWCSHRHVAAAVVKKICMEDLCLAH
jgi:hypothetical protein